MGDRLRGQIQRIDHDLHHIHIVRAELARREDRLFRQRQTLYSQLSEEETVDAEQDA